MKYFQYKGLNDSDSEVFSVKSNRYSKRCYKEHLMPEFAANPYPISLKRPSMAKSKPESDLKNLRSVIEYTLEKAKSSRKTMASVRSQAPDSSKITIERKLERKVHIPSAISKFVKINPLKFRRIMPEDPVDVNTSLVVKTYSSNNKIRRFLPLSISKDGLKSDSDSDKMDSTLARYYL